MERSTWNETNIHYLSQFLLNGIGPRRPNGHVYELNKRTRHVQLRKTSEVASRKYWYTDADETVMAAIEHRTSQTIQKIRKNNLHIDEDARCSLDALIYALDAIGPNSQRAGIRTNAVAMETSKIREAFAADGLRLGDWFDEHVESMANHDTLPHAFRGESVALII